MKFKCRGKLFVVGSAFMLFMNSACALSQLSRACQFYSIPTELKPVAAAFFYALGADADVLTLPAQSAQTQANKFILESLTTDYGRVRYLLFASRVVYASTGVIYSTNLRIYSRSRTYDMNSQWTSEQISDAMKADPKFSYYYLNRGVLTSARAGHPKIIESITNAGTDTYGSQQFMVTGLHWYYDPVGKQIVRLPDSQANTCNLGNIGLGTGLFDR